MPFSFEGREEMELFKKAFREKFEILRASITEIMGDPVTVSLQSEQPYEEKFRDSVIWHTENGAKICLNFDVHADGGFLKISLWIYRE